MIFDIENWLFCTFALFDTSPLHQFSKFNNLLWVCWFLGTNLSTFVTPTWQLDSPYCLTLHHNSCSSQGTCRAVASGVLGISVNLLSTRAGGYAQHITTCSTPGVSDLATALTCLPLQIFGQCATSEQHLKLYRGSGYQDHTRVTKFQIYKSQFFIHQLWSNKVKHTDHIYPEESLTVQAVGRWRKWLWRKKLCSMRHSVETRQVRTNSTLLVSRSLILSYVFSLPRRLQPQPARPVR